MRRNRFYTFVAFAIIAALPVETHLLSAAGKPLASWLLTLALFGLFLLIAGRAVTKLWLGALIDDRNVMSLARTQMAMWTVLVLSTYFAAAMWNLTWGHDFPLGIAIPKELWILMGISTVSLVGSPLLLAGKMTQVADPGELASMKKAMEAKGEHEGETLEKGLLAVNADAGNAKWSDLVTGEEVANAAHVDLVRVQMLFFTLVVGLAYAVAVARMFYYLGDANFENFPDLDESTLALLGISHAGYLTAKGSVHGLTRK